MSRKNTYKKKRTLIFFRPYVISYKNTNLLRRYIGITGKILPRRTTKLNSKEHRLISKAIRQSRRVGFLPSTWIKTLLIYIKYVLRDSG